MIIQVYFPDQSLLARQSDSLGKLQAMRLLSRLIKHSVLSTCKLFFKILSCFYLFAGMTFGVLFIDIIYEQHLYIFLRTFYYSLLLLYYNSELHFQIKLIIARLSMFTLNFRNVPYIGIPINIMLRNIRISHKELCFYLWRYIMLKFNGNE